MQRLEDATRDETQCALEIHPNRLQRDLLKSAFGHNEVSLESLQQMGGNPYLTFWEHFDGNSGRMSYKDLAKVPPGFKALLKHLRGFGLDPQLVEESPSLIRSLSSIARLFARDWAVEFFAWAIPNGAALLALHERKRKILEIGSGRGYWSWLLTRVGVEMYTVEPDRERYQWFWREPDAHTVDVREFQDHILMFCWPEHTEQWAYEYLQRFEGDTLVFIGEHGSCASKEFHDYVSENWIEDQFIRIPVWWGMHDAMWIYTRNRHSSSLSPQIES